MTNDETNPKIEARNAARQKTAPFRNIRTSFFIRHSSFFIRYLLMLTLASCTKHAATTLPQTGPEQLVIPEHGAYTGAYMDFGDNEDTVTIEAIEDFEKMVGKHQAIVASSSYWGEQTFPAANLNLIHRHGSIPMVYWSPWDKPYEEDKGPDKFGLTEILAGKWDAYIDMWADSAKQFGHPFFVSLCNEMNGSWFPWSGCFYGGEKVIPNSQPEKYEGPELFKKAYQYIVDRVRKKGATNVVWVFHLMNYSIPQDYWNYAAAYYPGSDYVDWIGLSVYGQQYLEDHWSPFSPLLDWPYEEITKLDPTKPVMLAEWGIGEFPQFGSKSKWISDAFRWMRSGKYPRLKAAIFWHERWQNEEGNYSNLRVNSTPEALDAYRRGVAHPFWLDAPVYKPR
jgi:beta-mannanase